MKSLLLLIITLLALPSFGQQFVKGTITDLNGEVPFVNVIIKHSKKGVLANEKGHFVIEVQPNDTLQISTLGYKTKDVPVGKQKHLDIVLDNYEELDEVVITGYSWYTKCSTRGCGGVIICECFGDDLNENEQENREIQPNVKLYPNPSKDGLFNLVLANDFSSIDLVVADVTGRMIINTSQTNVGSRISIDLSQQPSGIYIINLSSNAKRIASKKAIRI